MASDLQPDQVDGVNTFRLDQLADADYQTELSEAEDANNDLARIVSWRGEAEDQAAGFRSQGFRAEYAPDNTSAGGARKRIGRGATAPPKSSPDARSSSTPPAPSPSRSSLPGSASAGEGSEPKDEAA